MKKLNVSLSIEKYIADPYRVERYKVIEIQKISGMMRARSEKKKRESLESYLREKGQTLDDYNTLLEKANEPFYTNEDGNIYIPSESIMASLVNACAEAPSRLRIQNIRSALRISDFVTNKQEPDGVWERFAVVNSGMGKVSNQRGLRTNPYIENVTAKGTIEFDPEMVEPKSIKDLFDFAGRVVGIGASRKMGWGRHTVEIS